MANVTTKPLSDKSATQVLQSAMNDGSKTLSTSGFLEGKVGHKTTRTEVQSSPAIDDFRSLDVDRTDTGTTANTLPTITGLSNALSRYSVGQYLYGTGIPANAKILSIDSNVQITMDVNATASASVSIKFANLLFRLRLTYNDASRSLLNDAERVE